MRTIYRYAVPVDDQWHTLTLSGDVLHVASRSPAVVELWVLNHHGQPQEQRQFRVYGTGQPIDVDDGTPDHGWVVGLRHAGTAIVPGGELVWHLMERSPSRQLAQSV